jgi:hypothetical protein
VTGAAGDAHPDRGRASTGHAPGFVQRRCVLVPERLQALHVAQRVYVFDHQRPGDELVEAPFGRLAEASALHTRRLPLSSPGIKRREVGARSTDYRDTRGTYSQGAAAPMPRKSVDGRRNDLIRTSPDRC